MDFLSESLKGRLLFAIPKKGRLYEHCLTLLSGADIQFTRSHRLDVCLVRNHNLALVFLPAADIPRFVGEGNVDLGITGQDMVAEASAAEVNLVAAATPSTSGTTSPSVEKGQQANGASTQNVKLSDLIEEVLPLGFGACKLQIQVPERSTGLQTIEDLVGKRVATSFDGLSTQLFRDLDAKVNAERGLSGTSKLKTKIEYVGGSVEAACALGVADGIVDLVESGETMRAAGLHAIHTLMKSEAVLIRSKRSRNGSNSNNDEADTTLINKITSRIAGVIAANKYVLCEYNVPRKNLEAATSITPGRRAATVSPLDDPDWVAVSSMVLKKNLADIMDQLTETGATDILVIGINNCRV